MAASAASGCPANPFAACELDIPCTAGSPCTVNAPCGLVPPRPGFHVQLIAGRPLVELAEYVGSITVTTVMGDRRAEAPTGGRRIGTAFTFRRDEEGRLLHRSFDATYKPYNRALLGLGVQNDVTTSEPGEWQQTPPSDEPGLGPRLTATIRGRAEVEYACDDELWLGSLVEGRGADGLWSILAFGPFERVRLTCERTEDLTLETVSLDGGDGLHFTLANLPDGLPPPSARTE